MIEVLLVLAGIHFMIELLAAAYRIIDLWYDIAHFWKPILKKLTIIIVIGGLIMSLLPSEYANYFRFGAISYVFIHIGVWISGRLIARWLETRQS